jgi:hypothetical protein
MIAGRITPAAQTGSNEESTNPLQNIRHNGSHGASGATRQDKFSFID